LNEKVADQFYVLPTPDQLIFKLGHAKPRLLICLDNKSGIFALTIEEGSRDVTAVTSSRAHYRFARLPLGLKVLLLFISKPFPTYWQTSWIVIAAFFIKTI
jgi:hypothetical protein